MRDFSFSEEDVATAESDLKKLESNRDEQQVCHCDNLVIVTVAVPLTVTVTPVVIVILVETPT